MSEPKFKRGDLIEYHREENNCRPYNGAIGIIHRVYGQPDDIKCSVSWISHKFPASEVSNDLANGWSEECFVKVGHIDIDDIPAPLPGS